MLKWLLLVALTVMAAGCTDDPPSDMHERSNAALRDPWNYSPYQDQDYNISGGGATDFNGKAFKRDVNSMFGP